MIKQGKCCCGYGSYPSSQDGPCPCNAYLGVLIESKVSMALFDVAPSLAIRDRV